MFFQVFVGFCLFFSSISAFPCPQQCFCRPMENENNEFYRMALNMDCRNVSLSQNRFDFHAERWTIDADLIDDEQNLYEPFLIGLDLSDTVALTKFDSNSISFTGFHRSISTLTLTSSTKHFQIDSNSFQNEIYRDVIFLNLSSCCNEIPSNCETLFKPLIKLQSLDLSGTSLYKKCLNGEEMISASLHDLILRSNIYDIEMFHPSSKIFAGIRDISGLLDLQNSRFRLKSSTEKFCLFDLFNQISSLDLSNVVFESKTNDVEKNLAFLIRCDHDDDEFHRIGQLLNLYLRNLRLTHLPSWFTAERFSQLTFLDVSSNKIRHVDFQLFDKLRYVDLSSNPLDFDRIRWRDATIYRSINLRSTTGQNRTFDFSNRLEILAQLTADLDYSANPSINGPTLTNLPIAGDFSSDQTRLNLSSTNLNSFESNWIELRHLDVSSNRLVELNLEKQTNLFSLECSNQNLTKLTFNEHLKTLVELRCSKNFLKTLENFSPHRKEKLRLIDLSRNRFESLENLFANFTGQYLTTIKFQWNRVKIVREGLFHSGLFRLVEIDLSWNRIETIEKFAFQSANLQSIDLTGNPLKFVEPNSIFTSSLRFFFVFNSTNDFVERCATPNEIVSIFVNWFEQNGTLMKRRQPSRSTQIDLNRCSNRPKSNFVKVKGKNFVNSHLLFLTSATIFTFVVFAVLYLYRSNTFSLAFFERFRRYRRLDRNVLVDDVEEIDQQHREDDEIVMNLRERPFSNVQQATHV